MSCVHIFLTKLIIHLKSCIVISVANPLHHSPQLTACTQVLPGEQAPNESWLNNKQWSYSRAQTSKEDYTLYLQFLQSMNIDHYKNNYFFKMLVETPEPFQQLI